MIPPSLSGLREVYSGGKGLDPMICREYFLLTFFLPLPSSLFCLKTDMVKCLWYKTSISYRHSKATFFAYSCYALPHASIFLLFLFVYPLNNCAISVKSLALQVLIARLWVELSTNISSNLSSQAPASYVNLGISLSLPGPWFSPLWEGDNDI